MLKKIREAWKRNKKTVGKLTLTMAGMLIAGLLLIIGVYLLPTGRMKGHVANSADTFNYEGEYPEIVQGYRNSILDNYTDALMYATAIHPGTGNPVSDAMRNRRYEDSGSNLAQSLNDYANDVTGKEDARYEMEYPRYWHGYLVILKPLLLFFDIGEIRMFNMVIQGALLLFLFYQADKKLGGTFYCSYWDDDGGAESNRPSVVFAVFMGILYCVGQRGYFIVHERTVSE